MGKAPQVGGRQKSGWSEPGRRNQWSDALVQKQAGERGGEEKGVKGVLREQKRQLSLEGLQRLVWEKLGFPPGQVLLPRFLPKPG